MDKRTLAIFLFCLSIPLYTQWVLQNHPAGFNSLFDLQFINTQTGWAVGENNTILKTTNGGNLWLLQQADLTENKTLFAIHMIDQNVGFICGSFETILKTWNGGNMWYAQSTNPNGFGSTNLDVFFIDYNTGWITSNWGRVLRTSTGGSGWDTIYVNASNKIYNVQFINTLTGWIAGETGFMRKTTNGGYSWQYQFFGTTADFGYNAIHFLDKNTGWMASYRDILFSTKNGGIKWDSCYKSIFSQSVRFVNSETGWCGGSEIFTNRSAMYKTTDGGDSWTEQPLPFSGAFCSGIWPVTDSIGWAVYSFRIIHTTNGGDPIGIAGNSQTVPADYSLIQNYPNPFNSSTTVEYRINRRGTYRLEVYSILGNKVDELFNGEKAAGSYKLNYSPAYLSSGVYYCVLSEGLTKITRKMILLK